MTNMKLFIPKKAFYVYVHKIDGNVFYIGKGQNVRCLDSKRSKHYDLFLKQKNKSKEDVEVNIVEWFDNEEDALELELNLIHKAKEDNLELVNILGYSADTVQEAIKTSNKIYRNSLYKIQSEKFKLDFNTFLSKIEDRDVCLKHNIINFIKNWDSYEENNFGDIIFGCDGKIRTYTDMKKNNYNIGKNKLNKIFANIELGYMIVSDSKMIGEHRDTK